MIVLHGMNCFGCFHLFFLRMGVGDSSPSISKTEEVCEQRSGEWTVLCDLRYRRSVHDIWITGAKRSLAFFHLRRFMRQ